ncbi:hypothetical protein EYZ11_008371 [Aspergillus tanneri]|uniref:Uncharacterized protein n=1 Tax=Aspergillus tanneri TaxID=1220188 RepID=A0A4S3JAN5_9EURO|nr:hypothetical protein EYZ11_008371 [Aspergillus tanneri]
MPYQESTFYDPARDITLRRTSTGALPTQHHIVPRQFPTETHPKERELFLGGKENMYGNR